MAKLVGFGHAKGGTIVKNDDLKKYIDTNDEWITTRTGIKQRCIYNGGVVDLATESATDSIKKAGIKKEDIDFILVSTMTPDDTVINTAAQVMSKLGLDHIPCLDVNAACSGFLYLIELATNLVNSGKYKNVLIISAELVSRITDFTDRGTCILFGDGAGSAIVQPSKKEQLIDIKLNAQYSRPGVLDASAQYDDVPWRKEKKYETNKIIMNGREVFKFAVRTVTDKIKDMLEKHNLDINDIDHYVLHQANARIIEQISRGLGLPMDKFYVNVDRWGNTSSATVPICLSEMNEKKIFKPGQKVILAGFGAGLTWGIALMEV